MLRCRSQTSPFKLCIIFILLCLMSNGLKSGAVVKDGAIKCADMCSEENIIGCINSASPIMLQRNFSASVKGGIYHCNPCLAHRIYTQGYVAYSRRAGPQADKQLVIKRRQTQICPHTHLPLCTYCSWCFMRKLCCCE